MARCPNCGRKTYGDYCQWCNYPLIRRRFPWQVSRERRAKKLAEQAKLKAEQIMKDAREKAKEEAETESARIVAESKQKAEQLADEIKAEAKREAERIIKEDTQKVKKEAGEEWPIAMGKAEKKVQVTDKIKVFITDDQDLFRQGLRLFLSQTEDIELIGESDFLEYTVAVIEQLAPNLVLIDINLPWLSGLGLAQRVSQRSPGISVIILTSYEDDNQIFEALKAGVAGYLSKDIAPQRLIGAIRRVFKGEYIIDELAVRPMVAQRVLKQLQGMEKEGLTKPVSPQEMEMLGYFANGYLPKQVAHAVAISDETISELLNAATGFNWSVDDLYAIGERGSNIERAFNVREGLCRKWDTLPHRLLTDSVRSGPTKGQVVELDTLLNDFYRLCDWDIETGIPIPDKLNELGLPKIARDMESYLSKSR